ncbi:hypothetical protein MTR_5g021940 [Medicago truncatula]|uniref:Uncharacterized protein n=1 Tax=Medicago truncatula TaxID=3880 RepID=G7JW69_MEDTR|nr:hypothetical protein MTR_5g021940 [Medicago truncatula]
MIMGYTNQYPSTSRASSKDDFGMETKNEFRKERLNSSIHLGFPYSFVFMYNLYYP